MRTCWRRPVMTIRSSCIGRIWPIAIGAALTRWPRTTRRFGALRLMRAGVGWRRAATTRRCAFGRSTNRGTSLGWPVRTGRRRFGSAFVRCLGSTAGPCTTSAGARRRA
uniref:(northern house mosquito) hypothetical protein n=1 Tax=Culex pipiens TaxID=7175 RepID=A0A8D8KEL2_CULPI